MERNNKNNIINPRPINALYLYDQLIRELLIKSFKFFINCLHKLYICLQEILYPSNELYKKKY